MIETRLLRQFVILAEELHFGRAASRLNMAQPPLSQGIKRLEDEVGARLLDRDKRNVALTAAGHSFLETARKVLAEIETGADAARRIASGETGQLFISFLDTAHLDFLPRALQAFRAAYPGVGLRLREATTARQIDQLLSGEAHLGLMRWPGTPVTGCVFEVIAREPVLLALPARHPMAGDERVSLAALHQEDFIASPRGEGPGFHDQMLDLCRHAGFAPRIVQLATQMQTIVSLVACGLGVALVPGSLAAVQRKDVVFRPIAVDAPEHLQMIDLVNGRRAEGGSALVERFVAIARAIPPAA